MNWNKFIVMSSIALTVIAVPVATAQRGHRGSASRGGTSGSNISAPSARSFQSPAGRGGSRFQGSRTGSFRNRTGTGQFQGSRTGSFRNRTGDGRQWRSGHRGRWGHRHHGRYRRGFYPYYSYYPFGYPFWGTSFYYSDYPGYYNGSYGDSGSVAVAVQQELAAAGYYHGAIDGIIGNGTRRAIRRYESARGLPVDGRIDADLLATMGLG